jgi:hypothetical protein
MSNKKPFIPQGTKGFFVVPPRLGAPGDHRREDSGPEGTRTPDLLNAIETRSQLRHRPRVVRQSTGTPAFCTGQLPTRRRGIGRLPAELTLARSPPLLPGEFGHRLRPCTTRPLSDGGLTYYSCSTHSLSGGDEGARTPDLDSAIVALSQLSYIPILLSLLYHTVSGTSRARSQRTHGPLCLGASHDTMELSTT